MVNHKGLLIHTVLAVLLSLHWVETSVHVHEFRSCSDESWFFSVVTPNFRRNWCNSCIVLHLWENLKSNTKVLLTEPCGNFFSSQFHPFCFDFTIQTCMCVCVCVHISVRPSCRWQKYWQRRRLVWPSAAGSMDRPSLDLRPMWSPLFPSFPVAGSG